MVQKDLDERVTYEYGGSKSQIDYVLVIYSVIDRIEPRDRSGSVADRFGRLFDDFTIDSTWPKLDPERRTTFNQDVLLPTSGYVARRNTQNVPLPPSGYVKRC